MLFEGLILDQAQSIGLSANLSDHTKSIDLSDYSCLFIEVYNIHPAEILLYPETIFYSKVYSMTDYNSVHTCMGEQNYFLTHMPRYDNF